MPEPPPSDTRTPPDRRVLIFTLLCVVAAVGVVGYAVYWRGRTEPAGTTAAAPVTTASETAALGLRARPHLLFRNTELGPSYGRVGIVSLDAVEGPRYATALACDRVHAARESGLCLQASRGVLTTYKAISFTREFQPQQTFTLAGSPSRTRVSRDGRLAASTVFVSGDSYNSGGFSTRTTIFDLASSRSLGDLEDFAVLRDGQRFKHADFNFWGVTFADGERFYATLATGGAIYLVEGALSRRELRILREGVECPSLSPDGTKIAFKSRTTDGGRRIWRVHVLSFQTHTETIVNEAQSVDDQVEWLDDNRLLYALPSRAAGSGSSDVWVAAADGTGPSHLFLADASSPAVVR